MNGLLPKDRHWAYSFATVSAFSREWVVWLQSHWEGGSQELLCRHQATWLVGPGKTEGELSWRFSKKILPLNKKKLAETDICVAAFPLQTSSSVTFAKARRYLIPLRRMLTNAFQIHLPLLWVLTSNSFQLICCFFAKATEPMQIHCHK